MNIPKRRALCALLALCWSGIAAAAEEEDDLLQIYGNKDMVSIATGGPLPEVRAPAVTSVITAQDIKAMGATDLDQALESVPGLHVSMNHIALKPIYSFRGIHTRENPQVLMLLNGIPITNVFAGDRGQLWGGMPLENVARIEVIRGPGSALYGADAFAGTINIVTKTAANIKGTEIGARGGSFNTWDAWLQHGGKLGDVDAAFYVRAGNTDGGKGLLQQDALFGTNISRAPGPLNTERKAFDASTDLALNAWRLRGGYQHREVGMGAGLAGALDPVARGLSTRTNLDLSYDQKNWARDWDLNAIVGYYDNRETGSPYYTLFPAGAFGGAFPNGMIGNPGHAERHTHASASSTFTGFEHHRIRLGAGWRLDDMYQTSELKNYGPTFAPWPGGLVQAAGNPALIYLMPHKRNVHYAVVQDEWTFARDWTLTAGVRHDRYSDFGGTTNPRLALVWDAAYNITVKAMHGTAFRAPGFIEQYNINNPVSIGNPNIRPETITTDELALIWKPVDKVDARLNLFDYRMRNIIRPVNTVFQNSGGQDGRGFEAEVTVGVLDDLKLTGNYSLQHSRDAATGQDAGMAPHRRLFARADWTFLDGWQLGAKLNYVASRMREPGDTRAPVPDYALTDLVLSHDRLSNGIEMRAMVYNLFNRLAYEPTFLSPGIPSDLPLPRRALLLELNAKF